MTLAPDPHPSDWDWDAIQLVIFDVDGTLYNQRLLRTLMARDLLLHTLLKRDLQVFSRLRAFRRIRERLGEQQAGDFERLSLAETAAAVGASPEAVHATVTEWIETRPLPYLARCRYPGLIELFEGLRRRGKMIGILSDYPARAKLAALGLGADHVVSAGDDGVGFLKPHPRGLAFLMAGAGVGAQGTVLIGDRVDRDGLVARRLGVRPLIRSAAAIPGWQTFARYDAPLFAPLLARD